MAKRAYRVTNWKTYNRALINRGDITALIDPSIVDYWYHAEVPTKAGNPRVYSDLAIQVALELKALFRLPLRATQGILRSLLQLAKVEVGVPDYTTLCRRAVHLAVDLGRWLPAPGKPLIIVLDATGLKVHGEGEWKVRTHGKERRRTWRKVHFAVDRHTGSVAAIQVTASNQGDCEEVGRLLDETGRCDVVIGDGAYDTMDTYDAIDRAGGRAIIPPRSGAALTTAGPDRPISSGAAQRNSNIHACWRFGRVEWKRSSGYHQRSLVETNMYRYKQLFGASLSARTLDRQTTEARIRGRVMNRMTKLGMPVSDPRA